MKSHVGGGPALPGEPREAGHFQHHVLHQPTRGHVATNAPDPGADQRQPGRESKPAAKVRTRGYFLFAFWLCEPATKVRTRCVCVCLHVGEPATKVRTRCGCCHCVLLLFFVCFLLGGFVNQKQRSEQGGVFFGFGEPASKVRTRFGVLICLVFLGGALVNQQQRSFNCLFLLWQSSNKGQNQN